MDTTRHIMVEHLCAELRSAASRHGFSDKANEIDAQGLVFDVVTDPAGGDSLRGTWRGQDGWRRGQIIFNTDGSFFAEYDIVSAHPTDGTWFVEAIEAWGRDDIIKTDLRMLMAV